MRETRVVTTLSSSDRVGVQAVRVALLTPPGRGALAVVGVAGGAAATVVDRLFVARRGPPVAERFDGAIAFGSWCPTGEDVVVVRHAVDRIEVHGHGGHAAPASVIESLESAGAVRADWREWLAGAVCSREAAAMLPEAWGPKAAEILCRQAAGALDAACADLAGRVAGGDLTGARLLAARLGAASRVGLRLAIPWRVVFAGRVNAGKSSLMNALLGHARSIVAAVPGTTRDLVTAPAVLGGWAVELVDAAGSRDGGGPASATEQAGIARAAAAQAAADLVIRVVPVDDVERGGVPPRATELVVVSQIDKGRPASLPPDSIATSAVTGEGIGALITSIVDRLVPEERREPDVLAGPVPFTARQVEAITRMGSQEDGRPR